MNEFLRRLTAISISAVMLSGMPLSALSYTGIGEVTEIKRDTVGDGLEYTELTSVTENGKTQLSYIFEYAPAGDTLPLIRCGGGVYGTKKVGTIVSAAGEEGETVLGALNGDFYSMQTGVPLGVMIDGGRIVSSDDDKYAFAVTADGKAIIGKPELGITIRSKSGGEPTEIDHLNKYPGVWGAYLLDGSYSDTTHSTLSGTEIVIEAEGTLTPSGKISGKITEVRTGKTNGKIPENCYVLVVADKCARFAEFSAFKVGDEVELETTCAAGFENVITAVGGGDLILDNGVMPEGIIDDAHEKTNNPRTSVGIRADGTAVFFAVDGRTKSSYGLTETELSALMGELGCVTALNLDGGGSTTVMVKASDEKDCVYVNVPSDGSYRAVSNGILFVSKSASDGTAAALSVMPKNALVLSGSKIDFTALVLDKAYMPTDVTLDTDELTMAFRGEYSEGDGSVSGGSYIAGTSLGEIRLTASSGDLSGNVSVNVTDKLDSFKVTPSYNKVKSGTLVKLDIKGRSDGKDIAVSAGSMYYTLNGTHEVPNPESYPGAMLVCDLGYLDFDGNFQSFGGREGTVEIGIEYGDMKCTVTVIVGTSPDRISEFENLAEYGDFMLYSASGGVYIRPMASGFASDNALALGVDYKDVKNADVMKLTLRDSFPVAPSADGIKLWVKGADTDKLTAELRDEDGKLHTVTYAVTADYSKTSGWQELTAAIPDELSGNTLFIESLLTVTTSGTATREIIVDGILVSYGEVEEIMISDVEAHWAKDNIYSLYAMGIIRSDDLTDADGKLTYSPDTALTRAEFAKMLALRSGLDFAAYRNSGVKLDENTPEVYAPYVRAVLEEGLMSGRGTDDDGTVIFDGSATITREEACKVLGSLIGFGDGTAELTFTDADSISDWAKDGIAACVSAGIIGGYEDGSVRPRATVTKAEFATMLSRM